MILYVLWEYKMVLTFPQTPFPGTVPQRSSHFHLSLLQGCTVYFGALLKRSLKK